jgi:hypothetical protein
MTLRQLLLCISCPLDALTSHSLSWLLLPQVWDLRNQRCLQALALKSAPFATSSSLQGSNTEAYSSTAMHSFSGAHCASGWQQAVEGLKQQLRLHQCEGCKNSC